MALLDSGRIVAVDEALGVLAEVEPASRAFRIVGADDGAIAVR